jgi:uncharacterized membrane protein YesL
MTNSKFSRLCLKDLSKGVIMTIGTTIVGLCSTSVVSGVFPATADFINMGKVGLLSGAVYLIKNFLTNSKDEFLKQEEDGQSNVR